MILAVKLILIFLSMFFAHLIDDYCLQNVLAKLKQKKWWEENCPKDMYKYDYKIALIEHAFANAFCIIIPLIYVFIKYENNLTSANIVLLPISFFLIFITHIIIDHLKANVNSINLVQDQLYHLVIIFFMWICNLIWILEAFSK